ncbi:hypothetical protein [Streptomyces hoynatensis]|uniref:hypothetical protein n=1 Tax=Streptomyces hoynatensis TaxID=1141874 RepID=UPI0011C37B94|nr:hypothetical protein [Streptomyces hoynatensis]
MRDVAASVAERYSVVQADDAEAAINRELSTPIRSDSRLSVSGRTALSVSEETSAAAQRREAAVQHEQVRAAAELARLEALRELLLDRRLGLAWWVDRYADAQFAVGDPAAKTRSVLTAFGLLTDALRADMARGRPDENAAIRARVEELLAAFHDPATRTRAIDLLDTILQTLVPPPLGATSGGETGSAA